jgi:phospholipid/cholesterol/gamma-HCH transport system permease protein
MKSFFSSLGAFAFYCVRVLRRVCSGGYGTRAVTHQMHRIGVESLSVVNLCAFAIGLVLVVQTSALLARFSAQAEMPTIIGVSFVREIGPIFAAIMFCGRVGTGIAAEIGSMVVTEQIDAYRAFGADPLTKLAVPRVLAMTVMLPALTIIACVVGISSGYFVTLLHRESISGFLYVEHSLSQLSRVDILGVLLKGASFGAAIGLIATYIGFRTPPATEAVGIAATNTMVRSVLAVLVLDIILTQALLLAGGH